jgi:hypothetical protein
LLQRLTARKGQNKDSNPGSPQVIEHLPNKQEALSSNPTNKKKSILKPRVSLFKYIYSVF